jgi:hypothetical protein
MLARLTVGVPTRLVCVVDSTGLDIVMKRIAKLFVLAVAYTLTFLVGVAVLCRFSFYECEFVGKFALMAWALPVVIVVSGLLVVGMCVAYINFYIDSHMRDILKSSVLRFALGSTSGALPLFLWYLVAGSFPENFYPSLQYVPFLLGGIVVAASVACKINRPH